MLQQNNALDTSSDTNSVTMFQIDLQEATNDNESVDTETADNLRKDLLWTRVDLKIKVNAHANPEEQTVLTLQKFLKKLQYYDPKAQFAPWNDNTQAPPLVHAMDIIHAHRN